MLFHKSTELFLLKEMNISHLFFLMMTVQHGLGETRKKFGLGSH